MTDLQALSYIAGAISSLAIATRQGFEIHRVIRQDKLAALARKERQQEKQRRRLRRLQLRLKHKQL